MRFIVNGAEYEAASLERITGIDALALPKQAGMGVQTLAKRLEEMSEMGAGVMDSEPHLRALLAFLWLSRRLSGERGLTFEEACDFPIASLEIVTDDTDDEVADDEPDPTSSPAGAPVGGKPAA
jgi:hypothetical protein